MFTVSGIRSRRKGELIYMIANKCLDKLRFSRIMEYNLVISK